MGAGAINVFLVEDNPADARLVQEAFCDFGADACFTCARDGAEALELLRSERPLLDGWPPDVMLLDVNLPRMSGVELLARLRELDLPTPFPIVVLTSSGAAEDQLAANVLGAHLYLRKPSDFHDYLETVRRILELVRQAATATP